MDILLEFLNPYISDPTVLRFAVISLAALAFGVLSAGIGYMVFGTIDPLQRRLRGITVSTATKSGETSSRGVMVNIETMLGPVAQYVLPAAELERSAITRKLTHAGFRQPTAMQQFYSIKAVLAIVLPMAVLVGSRFFPELSMSALSLYALAASAVGLTVPSYVLDKLLKKRLKKLRDGFPDALDLLVVCVESGLGLSQAIQRVADELIVSHRELSEELSLVNAEVRVGVDRVQALKNLAARSGLDDIHGMVSLLIQTLRFGTSIADTLRIYSEEFRDKRMQQAEEEAAKMGTKMIFPLVLFMFPAFFVVAIGPSVIRLSEAFATMAER